MKKLTLLIFSLALLIAVNCASAATISFTRDIALASTDWSDSVILPKFDSALGTLDSLFFQLTGHVEGMAQIENQDASTATITTELSAVLTMTRPDGIVIVTALPLVSTSEDVAAYDGVDDFAGASGRTYSGMSADVTETFTTSDAGYLAMFTGVGSIILPVMAEGTSSGSGAGNLLQKFATSASATATVTYNYTTVPEPAAFPALLIGIVGTAFRLRRKGRQ